MMAPLNVSRSTIVPQSRGSVKVFVEFVHEPGG
jgi:hypothetical protein